MITQPEVRVERGPVTQNEAFAIGMAKLLEREGKTIAAAELRRLHAENLLLASLTDKLRVAWRDEVHSLIKDKDQLEAQRDALLEGYRKMKNVAKNVAASYSNFCDDNGTRRRLEREFDAADAIVRAALKAVEEGK